MKSIPKLIRRFVGILMLSTILLLILNIIVLASISSSQTPGISPWTTATEVAASLQSTQNGYILSEDVQSELNTAHAWAIFIDEASHEVIWHTENLPAEIPLRYSLSDIASLTRGYLADYPTYTGAAENGLVVVGYPKTRYWKHISPSWDYDFIANIPKILIITLGVNIGLIFIIYLTANAKLLKSISPIISGIQALPTDAPVHVREKGLLSELASSINCTAEILKNQNYELQRKETARANWIAGVSHDIRTPLSIVMGYAGQLENDSHLTEEERKKASVIVQQSERMRNLIGDLNLASKLEYNMQPLSLKSENAVAIVRQVVVDFINTDINEKYPIEWIASDTLSSCIIQADKNLLKRAVSNLIQNSINHNPSGCHIYVSVEAEAKNFLIRVEDDGIGVSEEQLNRLNTAPHYMVCDTNTTEQRHGLGLQIVKQIMESHHGKTTITHSAHGGLAVTLIFFRQI